MYWYTSLVVQLHNLQYVVRSARAAVINNRTNATLRHPCTLFHSRASRVCYLQTPTCQHYNSTMKKQAADDAEELQKKKKKKTERTAGTRHRIEFFALTIVIPSFTLFFSTCDLKSSCIVIFSREFSPLVFFWRREQRVRTLLRSMT